MAEISFRSAGETLSIQKINVPTAGSGFAPDPALEADDQYLVTSGGDYAFKVAPVPQATTGTIAVTVDYNDVNAVAIPAGTKATNQTEFDALLGGETNFKYIQQVWDALPANLDHATVITMAAGDHFIESGSTGFQFTDKNINVGFFQAMILGPGIQSYDQIVAPLTVLTHTTGGRDPKVTVSGTPFNGLDLRGFHMVGNGGQFSVIVEHTDDTLYLAKAISPGFTNGVSTFFVGRPATRLIASPDGVADAGSGFKFQCGFRGSFIFQDMSYSGFGRDMFVDLNSEVDAFFWRGSIDHRYVFDTYSKAANGRGIQCNLSGAIMRGFDFSIVNTSASGAGFDQPWLSFGGTMNSNQGYVGYSSSYCGASGGGSFICTDTRIDGNQGGGFASVLIESTASFQTDNFGSNRPTEIWNPAASIPALEFNDGRHGRNFNQRLRCAGVTGAPAVRLKTASTWVTNDATNVLQLEASPTGPANTDVGLEIPNGDPGTICQMKTGNTLTGTVGDVRFEGVVDTWANYETASPNAGAGLALLSIIP